MKNWLITALGFLCLSLPAHADSPIYGIKLKTIDGKDTSLAAYKGKTLLIVNTASKCGYTPQYKDLQALHNQYKERGFTVLGFPSNDFGGQEPGSNTEIKKFCQSEYGIEFPMFAKGAVTGGSKQPLYDYLTKTSAKNGEVKWNFEKFLIGPDGQTLGRFGSSTTPSDPGLKAAIENSLPKAKM